MSTEVNSVLQKEEAGRVLIVDDEEDFALSLEDILESRGYRVEKAHSQKAALDKIKHFDAQVALLDIRLRSGDGINLISNLKKVRSGIVCVMMTAYATIDTAVKALQQGAYDYLKKPVEPGDLLATLDHCFEKIRLENEKKQLEARLLQSQKMEAIATLAGGIAHEFNNALVGITGNADLLELDFPNDEKLKNYTTSMKTSAFRMAGLTNQLLAYARGGKYQPETFSLSKFIKDTLTLLQHTMDPSICIDTDLPHDSSPVEGDLTQLQMVLSALLNNASEAIDGGGGSIRVSVRDEKVDGGFTDTGYDLKPGSYVCITIEDNGQGMDRETRQRIFEPFFSTKFHGRGLGLSAAYGIVKNHGGRIFVDSIQGSGTVIRIFLPAADRDKEIKEAKKSKALLPSEPETILLIDDEEPVMKVARTMLERLGYRVLAAKTGGEAIDIAQTYDGEINLSLLDIKLPDMEGGNVYPLIMKARPNLKVIVCSGYSIDGPAQAILDAGALDFIQKPFTFNTLSEKLRAVWEIGNDNQGGDNADKKNA